MHRRDCQEAHSIHIRQFEVFFSAMADEVTDRNANKEILHFNVQYINLLQEKPIIQETFSESVNMQGRPTGAIIRNFILNNFLKHKIVLEHCRSQIYDGSRSMASKSRGASAVTKRRQPQVEFIYSRSYCIT